MMPLAKPTTPKKASDKWKHVTREGPAVVNEDVFSKWCRLISGGLSNEKAAREAFQRSDGIGARSTVDLLLGFASRHHDRKISYQCARVAHARVVLERAMKRLDELKAGDE